MSINSISCNLCVLPTWRKYSPCAASSVWQFQLCFVLFSDALVPPYVFQLSASIGHWGLTQLAWMERTLLQRVQVPNITLALQILARMGWHPVVLWTDTLDLCTRYQNLLTACSNAADSSSALEILDELQKTRAFLKHKKTGGLDP